MVHYLTRAECVSKHLELAGEKVTENITSIVLKDLLSEYDFFKSVHSFLKTKASFSEVKKAFKSFQSSGNLQTATASNERIALLSKGTVAKSSARKPKSSLGGVGVAVKVDINKPLVEYPSTFAGVLAMKRINDSRKTLFRTLGQVLRQESQT